MRRAAIRVIVLLALTGVIIGVLVLLILSVAIFSNARDDETASADAIIVLGAAQWNGRPSRTLQARLDHGFELYREGYAPVMVLTGGIGEGDTYSEAEVGHQYLQRRGIPDTAMVTVGGRTSFENLQQASHVLQSRGFDRVLLVSDPFHMFRTKQMAADLGLEPLASPTKTSPIRPGSELERRYMLRELVAYLVYVFVER